MNILKLQALKSLGDAKTSEFITLSRHMELENSTVANRYHISARDFFQTNISVMEEYELRHVGKLRDFGKYLQMHNVKLHSASIELE